MEVTTIKQLMNSIDEGVILVSLDRLITHINHHAETMLRFVPGEVLGQAVSRFISQSDVLDAIDECLDKGIKTASLEAVMSDEESYLFKIFPIRNKQKSTQRALIIVKHV